MDTFQKTEASLLHIHDTHNVSEVLACHLSPKELNLNEILKQKKVIIMSFQQFTSSDSTLSESPKRRLETTN